MQVTQVGYPCCFGLVSGTGMNKNGEFVHLKRIFWIRVNKNGDFVHDIESSGIEKRFFPARAGQDVTGQVRTGQDVT